MRIEQIEQPPPAEVDVVTITLTLKEATYLADMLGGVIGSGPLRVFVGKLYDGLHALPGYSNRYEVNRKSPFRATPEIDPAYEL